MSIPIAGDRILERETHVQQAGSGSQRWATALPRSTAMLLATTNADEDRMAS